MWVTHLLLVFLGLYAWSLPLPYVSVDHSSDNAGSIKDIPSTKGSELVSTSKQLERQNITEDPLWNKIVHYSQDSLTMSVTLVEELMPQTKDFDGIVFKLFAVMKGTELQHCSDMFEEWLLHSTQEISCRNGSCTADGKQSMTFDFVNDGSYCLQITPCQEKFGRCLSIGEIIKYQQLSSILNIESENHALSLREWIPKMSMQLNDIKGTLKVTVDNPPEYQIKSFEMQLQNYVNECRPSYNNSHDVFKMTLPGNSTTTNPAVLSHTYVDLKPGNYCVLTRPWNDIRCDLNNVLWNVSENECWHKIGPKELKAPSIDSSPVLVVSTNWFWTAVYAAIGIVLGISVAFILTCMWRSKKRRPETEAIVKCQYASILAPVNEERLNTIQPIPILLLYSRDCKPFQKLMVAFKNFLEKACYSKVFDPLNNHLAENISPHPLGWLQEKMNQRDIKIILVASEGALLRQEALQRHERIYYQDPHCFDDIFPYALRNLQAWNVGDYIYKTVFVVRFPFTPDSHLPKNIVPFTRYIIPLHLRELFKSLHNVEDNVPTVPWDNDRLELEELLQMINDMKYFSMENKDYLKTLFKQDENGHLSDNKGSCSNDYKNFQPNQDKNSYP